jgi:DNA mismatch repair protein MutS
MVNNERFVTPELKDLDESLSSANEQAQALEVELYNKLLLELSKFRMDLQSVAAAVATVDMLQGFAWLALKQDYCEPKLSTDGDLKLEAARHPVVERFVGRHNFVANNFHLSTKLKHALITGPNMAGKSTAMRQTAICVILCQAGSYVPAKSAELPIFDALYTRVGAADDLSRGQSTFMVEMAEAADILRNATQNSMVILDEVGRGTSTQDGLAIASAILEDMAQRIGCYSMFATHYHELVPLAQSLAPVCVLKTEVREEGSEVIFTHRLTEGASGSSFGIEVAKIAGIPAHVIERAQEFVVQDESISIPSANNHGKASESPSEEKSSRVEGASAHPTSSAEVNRLRYMAEKIDRLNVNRMTPLQALNFLDDLRQMRSRGQPAPLFSEDRL